MALQDELLELAAHMEWADALVWSTTLQSGPARADERIRGWLHHLHTVQRAFTAIWTGAAPDLVNVASFADAPALAPGRLRQLRRRHGQPAFAVEQLTLRTAHGKEHQVELVHQQDIPGLRSQRQHWLSFI